MVQGGIRPRRGFDDSRGVVPRLPGRLGLGRDLRHVAVHNYALDALRFMVLGLHYEATPRVRWL